jgi:multisubunit Na+/H+ antiporter MnhC subunit
MTNTIEPAELSPDEQGHPLHLRHIDVRAAVIVGGVFSAILGIAFLLAGWFIVAVAAQRGVLDQINSVSTDLSAGSPSHVGALQLALVWTAIVIGWTVAMTAVFGLGAIIFNAVLRLVGGIELDFSPTAAPARPTRPARAASPERLARTRHRVATTAARVQERTAKRLRQIDWAMLDLPALAKPVPDGANVRRSKAARARSAVAASEKGADTASSS